MLNFADVGLKLGPNHIVQAIELTVGAGECVCLVGPSGCGKTSLLRMAAGLLEVSSGTLQNQFLRTAAVFQEPRLLPWRTLLDNIALGLKAEGVARSQRLSRARELARLVGLAGSEGLFPHELSGGMQQRAALARALAINADLLLLDEPFSALDVGMRNDAQQRVHHLVVQQGIASLFVTHDLTEALRLAHTVVVMSGSPGRIVHQHRIDQPFSERSPAWLYEAAAQLLRQPAVSSAFLSTPLSEVSHSS